MTASIARVGQAFRVGPRTAWLIAACGVVGVAGTAALATRQDMLTILVGLAVLGISTLVALRWPILPLALFVALIPLEDIVAIEGLGTISRLVGILFAVAYALPRLDRLEFRAMPTAAWAYIAWVVVSIGWALDPGRAGGQLLTFLQLFAVAFFVADFVVHQATIVRPILWVYSLSATAVALIGIQTYATGGLAQTAAFRGQNPEHFAAVLVVALLFGLHEAVNGRRRVVGAAIALVTTIGVLVSGVRGAWVALVVVVLLFTFPQLSPKRRIATAALVLALAVVAYQVPGIPELIAERLSKGPSGREDIWSVAGTIYQSAPVLGVGFANFPVAYTAEMVRASDVISWVYTEGRGSHNIVIQTIVELGPVGLLLLAAFLGPLVVRRGWGPEAVVVQAALASLLIQALFVDMFTNRKPVWLVIGLAAGLAYLGRRGGVALDDRSRDVASAGATPVGAAALARPPGGPRVASPLP